MQGMLTIGSALLDAACVIGIDMDADALAIAQRNVAAFEGLPIDLVQGDVGALQLGTLKSHAIRKMFVDCNCLLCCTYESCRMQSSSCTQELRVQRAVTTPPLQQR